MKTAVLLLLATLMAVAAVPSRKHRWSKKFDHSRTEKLDSLPAGAAVPKDSTFLDKKESSDGNLIFGQYSYIEPRGSLVIVKYTVGKDGNGYTEKRLLTVNYSDNAVDQSSVKVDETGGSEDELIAKIIDRLRPTIKEMVAKEKTGEAQNGILTQSSKSVFDYFYSKLEKMESIMSQILCEMLSANVDNKKQKTEDELISGIIFKVIGLIPGNADLCARVALPDHNSKCSCFMIG